MNCMATTVPMMTGISSGAIFCRTIVDRTMKTKGCGDTVHYPDNVIFDAVSNRNDVVVNVIVHSHPHRLRI